MKKRIVALLALAAMVVAGFTLAACTPEEDGSSLAGTYTKSVSSGEVYSNASVKAFMEKSGKYVSNTQLFYMMYPAIGTTDGENYTMLTEGGVENYYTVTIELKDDGSYVLTKEFKMDHSEETLSALQLSGGQKTEIKLQYSGTYTTADTAVTLKAPTALSGNFIVAGAGAQYSYFGANYEDIDVSAETADDLLYPDRFLWYFNGFYFVENTEVKDMSVTIDTTAKSFTIA